MKWMLAAGLMCLAAFATPVAAEPLDGVVSGQVINGTSGGTSPAGDIVTLHVFNLTAESAEKAGERTTPVGEDGRFEFTGLDRAANVAYYVGTSHGGVSYSHPTPFQLKDTATRQADISVFEATTSDDVLQFDRLNLLVLEVQPDVLQVLQMGALINNSDRTFVTENPQDGALARAVRFPLPKGAMRAQFQSGFRQDDVIAGAGGIQVVSPLKPGRHEYALWFELPYNASSVDLTLQAPYPTAAFTIHVPEGGPKIESSLLTAQEPRQLGDRTFLVHSARDLAKASMISARLGGLPSSGSAGLSTEQLAMVSGGVVLLVLGAGVFAFSLRTRGSRSKEGSGAASEGPESLDLEQERLQLVVRLAALDERYAAGEIPESEYQAERSRDKQRLLELARAARP